jgi:hypothetical protein
MYRNLLPELKKPELKNNPRVGILPDTNCTCHLPRLKIASSLRRSTIWESTYARTIYHFYLSRRENIHTHSHMHTNCCILTCLSTHTCKQLLHIPVESVILVLKRPGKPLPGFSHGQSVEIRKTVNLLLSQAGTGTWGNFPSC